MEGYNAAPQSVAASVFGSGQAVLSPATILLPAGIAPRLETWAIALLNLNLSDEIRFFYIFGPNAHFFCLIPHIDHSHSETAPLPPIVSVQQSAVSSQLSAVSSTQMNAGSRWPKPGRVLQAYVSLGSSVKKSGKGNTAMKRRIR